MRGYHVKAGATGGVEWMVAGHHVIQLSRAGPGWRIETIVLQTYFQTGNRSLVTEAAAMSGANRP